MRPASCHKLPVISLVLCNVLLLCAHILSCIWLCNPMDCSLLVSSVHGIFQEKILEWVAISSSRGSSWPRNLTCVSSVGRQILYHWTSWETEALISWTKCALSHQKKKRKEKSQKIAKDLIIFLPSSWCSILFSKQIFKVFFFLIINFTS